MNSHLSGIMALCSVWVSPGSEGGAEDETHTSLGSGQAEDAYSSFPDAPLPYFLPASHGITWRGFFGVVIGVGSAEG